MNKPQRIVLIIYCLLVVCCCIWVPWHLAQTSTDQDEYRLGYGWLWKGPGGEESSEDSSPNLEIIGLELLAATALAGAAMAATPR